MACCLTTPSHYLKQCWLIISEVQWYSSESNFTRDNLAISHWNWFDNHLSKFSFRSLWSQWVKRFTFAVGCLSLRETSWHSYDTTAVHFIYNFQTHLWKICDEYELNYKTTNGHTRKINRNRMAWQWAQTLVEIRGTLADIGGTTK